MRADATPPEYKPHAALNKHVRTYNYILINLVLYLQKDYRYRVSIFMALSRYYTTIYHVI